MKRLLLICVISLLFVSGWGHVLAAAFCPNMQDMPGCAMQAGGDSASVHEGMEMGHAQHRPSDAELKGGSLERQLVSCCASRTEFPPAPVVASRGAEQSKRDLGAVLKPVVKTIAPPPPSFAPAVTSRQHAPPGAPTPRHVLVSVFLI
ncbi:MAG TPA: hypothetical protein VN256_20010 [Pyrinomonadaceae bacterium]|nr:hypothetical protein [Pyrinomonadaceae bacterium]